MNQIDERKAEMLAALRAETERVGRRRRVQRRARQRAMVAGTMATAAALVAVWIVPGVAPRGVGSGSGHGAGSWPGGGGGGEIAAGPREPRAALMAVDRRGGPATGRGSDAELLAALEAARSELGLMWVEGRAVVVRPRRGAEGERPGAL